MTPQLTRTAVTIAASFAFAACAAGAQTGAGPTATSGGPRPASHDSIIAVVQQFFTAMEAGDTAAIARLVFPNARFTLIERRQDSSRIGSSAVEEFIARLPNVQNPLRERMWNPQVLEHNGLAVLWAPYDFRVGDQFSHCGVDAFTLLRGRSGWRIAGVAYTVEPTGCPESPLGSP